MPSASDVAYKARSRNASFWSCCHVATPVQAMDITFGTTGMTEEDPTESSEQDLEGGLTSKEGHVFYILFWFLAMNVVIRAAPSFSSSAAASSSFT